MRVKLGQHASREGHLHRHETDVVWRHAVSQDSCRVPHGSPTSWARKPFSSQHGMTSTGRELDQQVAHPLRFALVQDCLADGEVTATRELFLHRTATLRHDGSSVQVQVVRMNIQMRSWTSSLTSSARSWSSSSASARASRCFALVSVRAETNLTRCCLISFTNFSVA